MKDFRYLASPNSAARCSRSPSSSSCSSSIRRQPSGGASRGNVVQTAANKGVLLALVAMAQTLVVLTAGIDLSVGMIFVLTNCLASYIVVGDRR
jgi:ribose transport system permease protein